MRWVDLHTHTHHSADSPTQPRALVAAALRVGLDGIAVTDHMTVAGARETARAAEGTPLAVIIGAEYSTDTGHVLGLFLREEIRLSKAPRWPWREVLEAIHAQGGVAVLAHPTRSWRVVDPEALAAMDGVEIFNARAEWSRFPQANPQARELWAQARRRRPGLFPTGGSDAHFPGEVGHGRTGLDDGADLRVALRAGALEVSGQGTLPLYEATSQAFKAARTRNWRAAPRAAARLAWGGLRTIPHLGPAQASRWDVSGVAPDEERQGSTVQEP